MNHDVPRGFQFGGLYCGVKQDATKLDLSLVVSDRPATAAGVYTTNRVFAAPVGWDRSHTPGRGLRAIVTNSGNANACTGSRGDDDARAMAAAAASICDASAEQVLVMSTGVIGHFLPLDKIRAGIDQLAGQLGDTPEHVARAARGMMTTDTVEKIASRRITIAGKTVRLLGMAKGAAMIAPRMGTMLAAIVTDAELHPAAAQMLLAEVVEDSFNCISIDGHMSTNDSVVLLANGASGAAEITLAGELTFRQALGEVCAELARAIPADGEGATHLVTIDVRRAADRGAALAIAKSIAESPLVKTAIAGADPNWGRIVSAVGYAGVPFDPQRLTLTVNGFRLYEAGAPLAFDEAAVSQSIADHRETSIDLDLHVGKVDLRFWTTDLTAEYVRLNSDYRT